MRIASKNDHRKVLKREMGEFKYTNTEVALNENTTFWSSYKYLRERENGVQFRYDSVVANYYKYMSLKSIWGKNDEGCEDHGAIFNTEFSPDGKLLLAACERSAFLVFDPLNQKLILTRSRAHDDGINCIRFLDSRSFLTCSDDKTIALWDARNLKSKVSSLVGHTSWVKSIEYCKSTKQLVTSAFDDTIRVWDLNRPSSSGFIEGRSILKVARLTRMKLTPCGTKMIISSIAGHLVVIHNLDLEQLEAKSGDHGIPFWNFSGTCHQKVHYLPCRDVPWSAKNKFEVIEEFPEDTKPWCISSLEVHPHGWCIVIRYTGGDWHQEWTALYDIQTVVGKNPTGVYIACLLPMFSLLADQDTSCNRLGKLGNPRLNFFLGCSCKILQFLE